MVDTKVDRLLDLQVLFSASNRSANLLLSHKQPQDMLALVRAWFEMNMKVNEEISEAVRSAGDLKAGDGASPASNSSTNSLDTLISSERYKKNTI